MGEKPLDEKERAAIVSLARVSGAVASWTLLRMNATVDALRERAEAAEREVEKLRGLLHSGGWYRNRERIGWDEAKDEPVVEERTYLLVRMPNGADLSCKATRDDAIDAALRCESPR